MKFLEFLVSFFKTLALVFFGLLTVGAGLCGAISFVSGMANIGGRGPDPSFAFAGIGLIVTMVAGVCTYALWRSLPDAPRDPPFETKRMHGSHVNDNAE